MRDHASLDIMFNIKITSASHGMFLNIILNYIKNKVYIEKYIYVTISVSKFIFEKYKYLKL